MFAGIGGDVRGGQEQAFAPAGQAGLWPGWNAWDGQVRDQFGVTWLIGYETDIS